MSRTQVIVAVAVVLLTAASLLGWQRREPRFQPVPRVTQAVETIVDAAKGHPEQRAQAAAVADLQSVATAAPASRADVILLRRDDLGRTTARTLASSAGGAASMARAAFSLAQPGDQLVFGYGRFDFGGTNDVAGTNPNIITLPPGTWLRGGGGAKAPRERQTRFENAWGNNAWAGCCFQPGGDLVIEDMTFASTCAVNEQQQTIGFGDTSPLTAPANSRVIFRRCRLEGRAWCLYSWSAGLANTIICEDCELVGGKWLATLGNSSGADGQRFEFYRCTFTGDADLSTYQGKVGNRLFGEGGRGGTARSVDCTFHLRGNPKTDLVVGGWTSPTNEGGSQWVVLEFLRCTFKIEPNGAKKWFDLQNNAGVIRAQDCKGSGPDGKLITEGVIEWKVAG